VEDIDHHIYLDIKIIKNSYNLLNYFFVCYKIVIGDNMKIGNWNQVSEELNKIIFEVFKGININELDSYTKRKMIFEYLCNNVAYDYELLEKIKTKQAVREQYLEIESVLKNKKGVCNAIAQVYKLLLEKVNIYSLCAICDDSTSVKHQLNLVYDEELDSFSFDDITSVIVNRGTIDDFFDYDLEDAKKNMQGLNPARKDKYWLFLTTGVVYHLVGRIDSEYLKFGYEYNEPIMLPDNIVSKKKRAKRM